EEPGKNTVFILTTNRIDHMMGTILSRCQQLRFESLTIEEIAKGLAARGLGDSLTIDTVARMADGSLSKAIELASSDDLPAVREQVLAFLRTSYAGNGMDTVAMVDQISRLGRENVKFQLQVMTGILRDLFLLRVSGNTDLIVNIDQLETLTKFAANLSEARLEDMIEAVERTAYLIERNVNLRLLLIALSRLLSSAMRGVRTAGMDINLLEA
ncbi:MAG: DNA polymerase III subunit delta', partial [Bacteroidetes Order II. Incertae sedis bacterium]|nr:DNA polymerase III subunit delta' [Bacteroidetes Order II. bacterium]